MKDLISIKSALSILTLFSRQRMTSEERDRVEGAIAQLSRAKVDPDYRAWLHLPRSQR